MRICLLLILILAGSSIATAQTNCERNLNEARADYSNGNLYAIPGKLTDCLEEGFSKPDKITALRLLTLTYININQQEKARETLIKLLNIQTDYQAIEGIDPSELFSLYSKIDTDIKYFIGVTFGFNYNTIQVHEYHTTFADPLGHSPEYSPDFSFPQIGAQFIYPLFKNWLAGAELNYQNQRFSYEETNTNTETMESTVIGYTANNQGINLNLNMRYMQDYYQWKPFIELGAVGRYNLTYDLLAYSSEFSSSVNEETIERIMLFDSRDTRRSRYNLGLSASIGSMIKILTYYGEVKFTATNFTYNHLNLFARENRHINTIGDTMILIDDDYTNTVYQLTFSFNLPFFNFK